MGADRPEVLGAWGAQPVGHARCLGVDRRHRGILRVEQAQRVAPEALALRRRQVRLPVRVVRGQALDVGRPARGVADRVELDLDAIEPGLAVEPRPELDDLGIDRRAGVADRLDVELPELPVPSRLRPVVPEHRPGLRDLDRLRPGVHPVLDVGSRDPGGRLRAEGPRLALLRSRREPEELLLDDVGDLADAPLEDRRDLEERGLDAPIAVAGGEVRGKALEARPRRRLGRQQVAGPARRSEGRHRAEV